MPRYVFDLECDGFLDEATRIHCLVLKDIDTQEIHALTPTEVESGIRMLEKADLIIGHNVIKFDIPVIQKLYPWFSIERAKVQDTLVLSRLLYADLSDLDGSGGFKGKVDGKLIGSHSLKAWGQRLELHKTDYQGGFEEFNDDMLSYNVQDVEVTDRLRQLIDSKAVDPRANELEHSVAFIVAEQERRGISFDMDKAQRLIATLNKRRSELETQLEDTFKPWYRSEGEFVPKKDNKKLGYVAGQPFTKIKLTLFNPGSRHHIADRLTALYGWKPKEFTPSGQPQVDEVILGKLPYPEAKILAEYFLVQKRLGMLSEGEKSWYNLVKDGRIHGEVITNGAVTGRATHRNPNLAQVPAVGVPFGFESRDLFRATPGLRQVGIDVSGLELRMLAHFLAAWDSGAYGEVVCNGDPHTVNQEAAGLPTRSSAKTFCYAYLYGAGDIKLGSIVLPTAKESQQRTRGKELRKSFTERTPGLKQLTTAVQKAAERGYLVGLDGRHLRVRSSHSALNTLLQSAGALICKRWLVEVDNLIRQGGIPAHQLLFVHDELQFEVDPSLDYWTTDKDGKPVLRNRFGDLAVEAISKAGEYFKIRVPLTGEYKVGDSWASCH